MNHLNEKAEKVANSTAYRAVQGIQALYREQLVEAWQIPAGARVLEIGCGQGDMTAALAQAVGVQGHVTAVDLASPDYGSPLTLGEATSILKTTPIGAQIEFRFNFDVLNPDHGFDDDAFDYVVLAHCSWYFGSLDLLAQTFSTIRPWARRLCFAEWDLEPQGLEQVAHMLAVLIQGQVEAFKTESSANVRTPTSRIRLIQLLEEAGWVIAAQSSMDTGGLQDADWEIKACLTSSLEEAKALQLPAKVLGALETQVEILKRCAAPSLNWPLNSYSLIAESPLNIGLQTPA